MMKTAVAFSGLLLAFAPIARASDTWKAPTPADFRDFYKKLEARDQEMVVVTRVQPVAARN